MQRQSNVLFLWKWAGLEHVSCEPECRVSYVVRFSHKGSFVCRLWCIQRSNTARRRGNRRVPNHVSKRRIGTRHHRSKTSLTEHYDMIWDTAQEGLTHFHLDVWMETQPETRMTLWFFWNPFKRLKYGERSSNYLQHSCCSEHTHVNWRRKNSLHCSTYLHTLSLQWEVCAPIITIFSTVQSCRWVLRTWAPPPRPAEHTSAVTL